MRVAVLDTGFDTTHPDLVPNINLDLSENFVPGETLQYALLDPFSHGTHVAGTIGAAQNDFGVIGVAPDVDDEWVSAREVAELRVAMQRAANRGTWLGTLYVSSAGNDGLDLDETADLLVLPAGISRVVSISATAPIGWATQTADDPFWDERFDHLASYSNYGRSAIDLSAPGGDFICPGEEDCTVAGLVRPCWVFDLVFSAGNGSWYWSAGTSMAAPHASGVAALILSEPGSQGMTPAQLEQAMDRRAADLGSRGRDPEHGRGGANSGH